MSQPRNRPYNPRLIGADAGLCGRGATHSLRSSTSCETGAWCRYSRLIDLQVLAQLVELIVFLLLFDNQFERIVLKLVVGLLPRCSFRTRSCSWSRLRMSETLLRATSTSGTASSSLVSVSSSRSARTNQDVPHVLDVDFRLLTGSGDHLLGRWVTE